MTVRANRLTARANGPAAAALPVPTQPSLHVRAFVDALERLSFDVTSLLAGAGLQRFELEDPDALIPCTVLSRLIGGACAERRTPNLAAHLAAATPIGAYPLLDYLVVTADSVGGALDQLVRYFAVVNAPVTLSLVREDSAVRLLVHPGTDPFASQYETAIIVSHLRQETVQRLRVSYVSLMHHPDDRSDLERLLGCPVRAPSAWSGIELPCEALQLPLRRRDPALRRVLEDHAASVAPSLRPESGHPHGLATAAAVRATLASRLGEGAPAIQAIARALAIAPRTLRRRLAAEGTSFHQLVDEARREAAECLLADASLATGEIGYLLGFSEPSAFHHAFRRWHGVTPRAYRTALKRSVSQE